MIKPQATAQIRPGTGRGTTISSRTMRRRAMSFAEPKLSDAAANQPKNSAQNRGRVPISATRITAVVNTSHIAMTTRRFIIASSRLSYPIVTHFTDPASCASCHDATAYHNGRTDRSANAETADRDRADATYRSAYDVGRCFAERFAVNSSKSRSRLFAKSCGGVSGGAWIVVGVSVSPCPAATARAWPILAITVCRSSANFSSAALARPVASAVSFPAFPRAVIASRNLSPASPVQQLSDSPRTRKSPVPKASTPSRTLPNSSAVARHDPGLPSTSVTRGGASVVPFQVRGDSDRWEIGFRLFIRARVLSAGLTHLAHLVLRVSSHRCDRLEKRCQGFRYSTGRHARVHIRT